MVSGCVNVVTGGYDNERHGMYTSLLGGYGEILAVDYRTD